MFETQKSTSIDSKLLIIDDEWDARFLLKSIFSKRGFQVFEADSLHRAFALINELDNSWTVTLDLNLGDGSGLEFLKKLKSENISCPVFVISANYYLREEAIALGATEFIDKPYSAADLDIIRSLD